MVVETNALWMRDGGGRIGNVGMLPQRRPRRWQWFGGGGEGVWAPIGLRWL